MAGPKATIQVEGRRELEKALRAAGERSGQLKEIHQRLAIPLLMAARMEAPSVSGALAGSIRASATNRALSVKVGSRSVPYAGPIHYGWPRRNIAANPFLIRARDSQQQQIAEGYRKGAGELADRVMKESWHG